MTWYAVDMGENRASTTPDVTHTTLNAGAVRFVLRSRQLWRRHEPSKREKRDAPLPTSQNQTGTTDQSRRMGLQFKAEDWDYNLKRQIENRLGAL